MGGSDTPLDHARWSHERSYWLREALANDPGAPCPPLSGETKADVLIVGGGYTGMWTAHFLKEREPALDVVVLEQDICGGGPSGRNGGVVETPPPGGRSAPGWLGGGRPRARASPRDPRAGRAGVRRLAGPPVPGREPRRGDDAGRQRSRAARRARDQRVGPAVAAVPSNDPAARDLHRPHRSGARAACRD